MSDSSIADLILSLGKKDIKLWVEEGQLRLNAPKGALTPELKNELVKCKPALLAYLADAVSTVQESIPSISANTTADKFYPVSFAQERFWYLHELYPDAVAYHVQDIIPVEWPEAIIIKALEALVQRHAILRTTYHMRNDAPVQCVKDDVKPLFSLDDISVASGNKLSGEILRQAQNELRKSFDLTTGPVWRARLLSHQDANDQLILTVHHIATDGRSTELLRKDFIALCQAFSANVEVDLSVLPIQYLDFASWQREWMSGDRLQQQLDYWVKRMEGAEPHIDLPYDSPRSALSDNSGEAQVVSLGGESLNKLRALAAENKVTLYMALLSVFNILLARYTRQTDIVVGTPVAGRDRSETENIAGLFLNTLVLRNEVPHEQNFSELLQSVKASTLGAFEHQALPFEKLVEALKPEREANANPIYQVMFNYFMPQGGDKGGAVNLLQGNSTIDIGAAQVDLSLYVEEETSNLNFGFAYNSALFDADTVIRMAGHFINLLQAVINAPTQAIGTLPMLSDTERQQILVEWNDTAEVYPQDVCLHQLFEEQVQRTPDAIAVVFDDTQLTYQELNQRADQVANYLVNEGVCAESVVAVLMERSLEMVIALYGILKAGGGYLPIAPELPPERISFMLQDTQTQIVLTQKHLAHQLDDSKVSCLSLDDEWQTIAETADVNRSDASDSAALAYIIYTSGSTGKPKGVMNCHSGIVNRILWMQSRYQLTQDDRVLQKTPFSFDVSVWEFFWPLMCGASLVLARPGGHKDPRYLSQCIEDAKITTLHFVPSMLKAFLEHGEIASIQSLKRLICSGEALSPELVEQFFQVSDAELHNLYGPTEAAVDVTHWACVRNSNKPHVPIGKPVANTQLYLLDAMMRPVPVGVPGELYIGGVQVARGYLNNDELTVRTFIPDPFSQKVGARLYKTGDLARYLTDGNIEYLGRLDHQIKLRGFRIELGEIEAILERHAEISMAVTIVREDTKGDQRLVAYVTAQNDHPMDMSEVREYLHQYLPEYMVPTHVVWLREIPLTPSGKVDRKALPAPSQDVDRSAAGRDLPSSEYECLMARIWEELLDIDEVYVFDTFFDLGGHSLLTLKVVSRFEDATAIRLNPADLVTRTLRQLVAGLEDPVNSETATQNEKKASAGLLGVFKKALTKAD